MEFTNDESEQCDGCNCGQGDAHQQRELFRLRVNGVEWTALSVDADYLFEYLERAGIGADRPAILRGELGVFFRPCLNQILVAHIGPGSISPPAAAAMAAELLVEWQQEQSIG